MTLPEKPDGDGLRQPPTDHAYREALIACEQKAQTSFDKTVITLSGGALAISFAFLGTLLEKLGTAQLGAMKIAWLAWVLSVGAVLVSHYLSTLAMREALERLDADRLWAGGRVGGAYETGILVFNALGGVGFLVGAVAAGVFLIFNL